MMDERLLLIGGPGDGQWVSVSRNANKYVIPILPRIPDYVTGNLLIQTPLYTRAVYECEEIEADDVIIYFLRWSEITCADAIRLMIEGYTNKVRGLK